MATSATPIRRRARKTPAAAALRGGTAERRDQVQALSRALAILNALAEADEGMSLTDLAQQLGLPPSTTHRLLTTLQQDHFVRFDGERALWAVGVQSFIVGNAFLRTRQLVQTARPHMRALMEESGETVNLAVEDEGKAIFLHQVECRQMMRALTTLGSRVPLHCSGVGKALLMSMGDPDLVRVLQRHGLPRLTQRTLVRPAELRVDLDAARARGYAFDDEEHAVGLRCVAASIFDELGEAVAAISISGPAARITDDRIPLLGNLVRRSADAITAEYGGRPKPPQKQNGRP